MNVNMRVSPVKLKNLPKRCASVEAAGGVYSQAEAEHILSGSEQIIFTFCSISGCSEVSFRNLRTKTAVSARPPLIPSAKAHV